MTRAFFLAAFLTLSLAGCADRGAAACASDADCTFGDMCTTDGACAAVGCTNSSECPLGDHCSAERSCEAGCAADTDCAVGAVCDALGECVSQSCSDTRTDCAWGEVCTADGECVAEEGIYCDSCETDADCPGGACWDEWCGPRCETRDDCPAGFDCLDVGSDAAPERICLSDCWSYD